jgi:hypothetical protein
MISLKIKEFKDLVDMSNIIVQGKSKNYIFELVNDIDMGTENWTPAGFYNKGKYLPFEGQILGNRHIIKNLKLVDNFTLTGFIAENKGLIKDLYIDNTCSITLNSSISQATGSICAVNHGTITGCKSSANIIAIHSAHIGGICGISNNNDSAPAYIDSCFFYGTIKGLFGIGGICGSCNSSCVHCENRGTIQGDKRIGGIIGFCKYSCFDSKNIGTIKGVEYIGGIIGYFNGHESGDLINEGHIYGEKSVHQMFGFRSKTAFFYDLKEGGEITETETETERNDLK